jgi:hypothetical protein
MIATYFLSLSASHVGSPLHTYTSFVFGRLSKFAVPLHRPSPESSAVQTLVSSLMASSLEESCIWACCSLTEYGFPTYWAMVLLLEDVAAAVSCVVVAYSAGYTLTALASD